MQIIQIPPPPLSLKLISIGSIMFSLSLTHKYLSYLLRLTAKLIPPLPPPIGGLVGQSGLVWFGLIGWLVGWLVWWWTFTLYDTQIDVISLKVDCKVDSHPAPSHWWWTFNNSHQLNTVDQVFPIIYNPQ